MPQSERRLIHGCMPHGPRHLATRMKRSAHTKMKSGAIQSLRLLCDVNIVQLPRLLCRRIVVGDEIAIHPLLQKSVNCGGDGKTASWAGRGIVAAECVSINWRPLQRLKYVGRGVSERIEDLAPHFTERIVRTFRRRGQLGKHIGTHKVIGAHPTELHKESRVDPLCFVKLLEQWQDIAGKRWLPRLWQPHSLDC